MAYCQSTAFGMATAITAPARSSSAPSMTVVNGLAKQRYPELKSLSCSVVNLTPKSVNFKSLSFRSTRCAAALTPELKSRLDKVVTSNKVVLFMKGNKDFPQCGFSNSVVQILKSLNVPFEDINILDNEMLRQAMKEYSAWPTFPQLYIDGEFFGGCDITVEAYNNGELQELLEKTMCP